MAKGIALVGIALVMSSSVLARPPPEYNPEYIPISFKSAPGKCAALRNGKIVLVDCCSKNILKVSCLRARRGPLSSYCNLVTPAAGGGYSCGYISAAGPTEGSALTIAALNRNESSFDFGTNPDDEWIYFTSPDPEALDMNQWMLSNNQREETNVCLTAAADNTVQLKPCVVDDPTQVTTGEMYFGAGVNGQCFTVPSGGKAVLKSFCKKATKPPTSSAAAAPAKTTKATAAAPAKPTASTQPAVKPTNTAAAASKPVKPTNTAGASSKPVETATRKQTASATTTTARNKKR